MASTTSPLDVAEPRPAIPGRVRIRDLNLGEFASVCFLVVYLIVELEPFVLLRPLPGSASSVLVPFAGLTALALAPTEGLRRMPVSFTIVALLGWMGASYFWAESTTFSFVLLRNELPALAMLLLVVSTMRPRVTVAVLLGFFTLCGIWSALSSLTLPMSSAAVNGPDGALQQGWRGTFGHKNILGIFMVLALGLTLTMQQRRYRAPLAVLFVAVVLGTRSATAGGGLVAMLVAWFWLTVIGSVTNVRDRVVLKILSVASLVVAVALVVGLLPSLVAVYGKDLTFSGRTDIWAASIDAAVRRPIQGYGVGGIWFDVLTPTTRELHRAVGFGASHAHNGVLNLWLEAGLIGVALYFAVVAQVVVFAVRALRRPITADFGRWAIITVVAIQMMAISEPLFRGAPLGIVVILWAVLVRLDRQNDRLPAGR